MEALTTWVFYHKSWAYLLFSILSLCDQRIKYVTPITHYSITMLVYWLYRFFFSPTLDKDFAEGMREYFHIISSLHRFVLKTLENCDKRMCIVPKSLSFILKK